MAVSSGIGPKQHVMELLSWSDSLLLKFSHNAQSKVILQLHIWGRTRTLSEPVMDTFRRHVDCLDLRLPVYTDPEKGYHLL
ncbi:hypothetical protein Z043_124599 [Scleropages formosus]|uniref:Uncharacterized protein n=1 Tax=Scleropages formosus TaxID=113540 RepID=A0A0P7TVE6_SCLFO|nr:hypothetical protein Z043_124599 [Scleropages formosus]